MPDPHAAERLYRHSRREAIIVLIVWALALVWSVGYCYLNGYQHESDSPLVEWGLVTERTAEDLTHIAGIPDWVLIGILLPWVVCTLLTIGFALFGMTDDDLGAEAGESHGH
jgi:hypothetical protein